MVKSLSAEIERLKADFSCFSYEGNTEDISIHETYVFGSPAYDEELISSTDQEQPTSNEYPSEDDEEQSSSMVPVYDDYEFDPWESHEGEMEELNVQFISYLEPVNESISPGVSQPASFLHPPIHSENIKRRVRNNEGHEVISYQLSFPDYKFCDLGGYIWSYFFQKHWSLPNYSYYHHSMVLSVFQSMFSFCCHTSLTFCGSSTMKKRIILPDSLGGYGGSFLSPSTL
jgi:hypothetical protein